MKMYLSSFFILVFLGSVIVGCGSGEARQATDGATLEDIAAYEAAVAKAEGNMAESDDAEGGE